jgi:hypothetical protein
VVVPRPTIGSGGSGAGPNGQLYCSRCLSHRRDAVGLAKLVLPGDSENSRDFSTKEIADMVDPPASHALNPVIFSTIMPRSRAWAGSLGLSSSPCLYL